MVELQLFKDLLNFEIKRITNLCNFWEKETLDVVPEEIQGKILSVIGLSKLLINEKLKQFRELINSYNPSPDKNCITIDDLRGFWDLVNIQIDDLNKKFNELDILKSNRWENKRLVLQTNQNLTSKCRRQNSCDKIHSEAAKSRLAAAKEKLQARMTKECCNNDEFYVY